MKSVLIAYAALLLLCAGLTVAGVYVILGLGYALLASGAAMLGLSEILRKGMISGG